MGNENGAPKAKGTGEALSEEELNYLLQHTNFVKEEILDYHRKFKGICSKSGELDKKSFIEYFERLRPDKELQLFGAQIFNAFDANKNGRIDFCEFLIAISLTTDSDPEQKLRFAFKMYDINNDDKLDIHEVEKIIEGIYDFTGQKERKGKSAPREVAKSLLRKCDKDESGYLTQDEFIHTIADPTLNALDYFALLKTGKF